MSEVLQNVFKQRAKTVINTHLAPPTGVRAFTKHTVYCVDISKNQSS